ncbi:DNA-directed RNA polymerase III subunit RPC2-like [Lycium ferocissimum]|uniref:DNA-directed RNA polymerase III subunit RPC2-like n=1 Tax=Lycium ferocissimum TaxID=112874 RepID=UPI00281661FA|nr:DNA-directed RNA polymerase III subunit RPC2-like [Lycium ferocissimum]
MDIWISRGENKHTVVYTCINGPDFLFTRKVQQDYLGNKRYELSGHLLSLLFEDLLKRMNDEARKTVDASLAKRTRKDVSFLQVCTLEFDSKAIITVIKHNFK